MQLRHGFLAILAASSFLAGVTRADRLDEELHRRMPKIVEQLKEKYTTAGVLRFRVQEGAGREGFTAPMSGRMGEKLETLLLIHNAEEEEDALRLIRDAGVVASQNGIASFSDGANREKLFRHQYPLAWGSGSATPEVFLTGKVRLNEDRTTTTVTLEAFDAKSPKTLRQLAEFQVPTDRHVVRDMGLGFALRRDAFGDKDGSRGVFDSLEDKVIVADANKKQPVKGGVAPAVGAKKPPVAKNATNVGGISVEMLVNGQPRDVTRGVTEGVQLEVISPRPKDKLVFGLKNTTGKTLGVVLQLNGVNTLFEQKLPAEKAAKWVLPPKTQVEVKGFMVPEGKIDVAAGGKVRMKRKPFRVLVGEDAAKRGAEFGEKKGLIEIDVFEDVKGKNTDRPGFSIRGLPPSKEQEARKAYQGLRSAVLKSSQLKTVVKKDPATGKLSRELIVAAEEAEAGDELERRDMGNPRIVAHLPIRVEPNDDYKKD